MLDQSSTEGEINEMMVAYTDFMEILAILQHHDAITGTNSQSTADDYQWRLSNKHRESEEVYTKAIKSKIKANFGVNIQDLNVCRL
jgi:hypothetical protein